MKRKLDLNINNTFRSANLNFINFKDYGKINKNDMDYDVTKKYIIYADDINFNFLEQLCKDLYEYIIITSKPISTYLLFDIGSNNNASILYNIKEFSDIESYVQKQYHVVYTIKLILRLVLLIYFLIFINWNIS